MVERFCSFPCSCSPHRARPAPRLVAAHEYPHREALWKVLCSRDARSESLSVNVVHSRPLQELPCSGRSSTHVVFLQLLTKSSSRATCAFSLNVVVPMLFWRPEPCPSRCRWRSRPELLMSLHSDCSSHPFVLGARLVKSHGYVHLVLLPPACLQLVIISRFVAARPCRTGATATQVAVPHRVQPPGTVSRSRCRSLASVSHPVSTPRPLKRPSGIGLFLPPLCSRPYC